MHVHSAVFFATRECHRRILDYKIQLYSGFSPIGEKFGMTELTIMSLSYYKLSPIGKGSGCGRIKFKTP